MASTTARKPRAKATARRKKAALHLDGALVRFRISALKPIPENEQIYGPIRDNDKETIALSRSIKENGLIDNLVITLDRYIISGHRRTVAAKLAGLKSLLVRVEPLHYWRDRDEVLRLLREHNRHRNKTAAERIREEVISAAAAGEARRELRRERREASRVGGARLLSVEAVRRRCEITEVKWPLLKAAVAVMNKNRKYRPFSIRQIHYWVLPDPPLTHSKKPGSRYKSAMTC